MGVFPKKFLTSNLNLKPQKENIPSMENNAVQDFMNKPKEKLVAGLLAIFLGWLGIHKFYLGYNKAGIIQLIISFFCGIGGILGLIEGILYLTKSDEEFQKIYVEGKKEWL